MTRAEALKTMTPHLIADVTFYEASAGGRKSAALPGWGCVCMVSQEQPLSGYDAWLQLGDQPIEPGAKRRLGLVFLSEAGADAMRSVGKFYLWEGKFVGEARFVE